MKKIRKLSLDVSELRVESFETADGGAAPRGTVRANACSDFCSGSCEPTCGIVMESADCSTEIPAFKTGDGDYTGCLPCCV
ncbi:MAG TPA: hypothetical protein VF746_15070 [Longimicrobium sp.]|jgi:hypothetical protein